MCCWNFVASGLVSAYFASVRVGVLKVLCQLGKLWAGEGGFCREYVLVEAGYTGAAQLFEKDLCVKRTEDIHFATVLQVVVRFVSHGHCVCEGSLWSARTVQERWVQFSVVENR